ncbi:hypothetical protein [Paracoccus sp. 22332]|uniref:hypothetical protein n=1 Tax=Paracoccus sp. 22332 TaxID=3453913 RepID=UPI003F85FF97
MKTQDYTVLEDGFIHGLWTEKGAKIALTTAQAGMFLDHGRVALVVEQPEKKDPAKKA